MNSILDRLKLQAQQTPRRIILPEAEDPRVVEAANRLVSDGLARVAVVDPPVHAVLDSRVEILDSNDLDLLERAAQQLFENRQHRGMTLGAARTAAADPVMLAALCIRLGLADGGVAGSLATTAHVLRCGIQALGTEPGCSLVSSFFLMQSPEGRCDAFADCAVVPEPDAQQLAEIATTTADNFQLLTNIDPRVAMLSFSTRGSADGPTVEKVREATALARQMRPQRMIDGELQFDAAWVPAVGQRKAPDSPVAGQANVYIFPDLNSGNIGYKIAERIGELQAIGPILQGMSRPWMDLSRGCSVDDIVNVAVVASCLASGDSRAKV